MSKMEGTKITRRQFMKGLGVAIATVTGIARRGSAKRLAQKAKTPQCDAPHTIKISPLSANPCGEVCICGQKIVYNYSHGFRNPDLYAGDSASGAKIKFMEITDVKGVQSKGGQIRPSYLVRSA